MAEPWPASACTGAGLGVGGVGGKVVALLRQRGRAAGQRRRHHDARAPMRPASPSPNTNRVRASRSWTRSA